MHGEERQTSEYPCSFWSPPIVVDQAELNPAILRQIETCADKRDYRAYRVQVFSARVGPPEGMFEIAFNAKTLRACAVYEAVSETGVSSGQRRLEVATDPIWITAATPRSV